MIKYYNEDCMEGMKRYGDKHFDLAIVDPPYGINITCQNMGGRKTVRPDKTKKWDKTPPDKKYFEELFRVSKNQVIWGGNYFELPVSRYFCVWDKGEAMYDLSFAECEMAWVRSGGTRIFKLNPNQLKRIHPTQKPVKLYKWLLHKYAKKGDLILDTHVGSASSLVACYLLGFSAVGFEIDEEYYKSSKERLENVMSQGLLFNSEVEKHYA